MRLELLESTQNSEKKNIKILELEKIKIEKTRKVLEYTKNCQMEEKEIYLKMIIQMIIIIYMMKETTALMKPTIYTTK